MLHAKCQILTNLFLFLHWLQLSGERLQDHWSSCCLEDLPFRDPDSFKAGNLHPCIEEWRLTLQI